MNKAEKRSWMTERELFTSDGQQPAQSLHITWILNLALAALANGWVVMGFASGAWGSFLCAMLLIACALMPRYRVPVEYVPKWGVVWK